MNFPCLKVRHPDGSETFEPLHNAKIEDERNLVEGRISSYKDEEGRWISMYTALDAKRDAAPALYDAAKQFLRVHGNCGSPAQQEAAKELEAAIALAERR